MSTTVAEYRTNNKIHPKKFALYVACASIAMMFAALTSAYVVRMAAGNWLEFRMPQIFYVSTVAILVSSATLQGSYAAFRNKNQQLYRGLLVVTFILGITFLVLQYQGWLALQAIGVELTTNPSGSFVYTISGLHAAHIIGGLAVLAIALLHAFALPWPPNKGRKLRFELSLIYWHFVDLLWVYLLVFLVTTR